jgi:hypothetical protein
LHLVRWTGTPPILFFVCCLLLLVPE